jgi:N4-gp56 family major capsid protein
MAVFSNINLTTSSGLAPGVVQYYERTLLDNLTPEMVHSRDAQKKTLPLHNGKRVQFRKPTPLSAVTTPLTEGTTPTGQTIAQTSFTATVRPFGGYVPLSDEVQWYMLDDIHKMTAQLLADQAALSLDTISRDAICAGSNVQFASGCTNRTDIQADDVLTYAEIKKAVRTLKRKNIKPFPDGFYHAIVHPDTVHDLTSDSNWTDVSKYQDKSKVEKYELGTIYKVKFFESTNAKAVTVDDTYVCGTQAYLNISNAVVYDSTNFILTIDEEITEAEAREMTGRLVYVYDGVSSIGYEPMLVEYAVAGAVDKGYLKFRWNGANYANWKTGGSNLCKVYGARDGNSATAFNTVVYGQDAFGSIELAGSGKSVEIIVNPAGSSGAEDPLAQRGTVAWKAKGFCTVILDNDAIVRIEHGATA